MNSCVVLSFCLIFGLAEAQGSCGGCIFRGQICDGSDCRCPKGMKPMGNSCGYPPPPATPKTPTEEEKKNSVLLEILNAKIWGNIGEAQFRRYIANTVAHEYCMNNQGRCGLSHELEKRMNTYFNGKYIGRQAHRLPGYPEKNGQDVLMAFYILNPPDSGAVKVIPAKVVVELLNSTLVTEWIKISLGKDAELGNIKILPPNSGTSNTWQWPLIGVIISVLASFLLHA